MSERLPKNKSCDYCRRPPVAWFAVQYSYSRMGHRRGGIVYKATCAEHEGCENWTSNLAIQKPQVRRIGA